MFTSSAAHFFHCSCNVGGGCYGSPLIGKLHGMGCLLGERLTNYTVDGVAGFRRLVSGRPSAGREFGDSIDRKIGQAREHRAEVVADREVQTPTGFDDRNDGGNPWPSLLASDVDPVLAS